MTPGSAAETRPRTARAPSRNQPHRLALVTGATGYVGGLLVGELLSRGWAVRTLSRSRTRAESMPWASAIVPPGHAAGAGEVDVCEGDAADAADVVRAMEDVTCAWYLLHSLGDATDLVAEESAMATTFAHAAEQAAIARIVYLGGLHADDEDLSEHLTSRTAVGEILLASAVPCAVLQAGVILGDGSASFTMLRDLAERLPGAIGPRWIRNRITPIGVRDVLHYLASAAEIDADINRTFDIGGSDTLEYAQMMQAYARALDLPHRLVLTAPVTTPGLAAHWIGLVTRMSTQNAHHLIGSLLNTTVLKERDLEALVGTPSGGNQTFEEAVLAATEQLHPRRWGRILGGALAAGAASAALGVLLSAAAGTRCAQESPVATAALDLAAATVSAGVSALVIADAFEEDDPRRARSAAALFAVCGTGRALSRFAVCAGSSRGLRVISFAAAAASEAAMAVLAYRSAPERAAVSALASSASLLRILR